MRRLATPLRGFATIPVAAYQRTLSLGVLNATQRDDVFGYFRDTFRQVDPSVELKDYRIFEGKFPELTDCDHFLLSGSPCSVYDDPAAKPWVQQLHSFVGELLASENKAPRLIGVCFGHQEVAWVLNRAVSKSNKGWGVGIRPFRILQRESWMGGQGSAGETVRMLYTHQDQVTQLPPHCTLLGSSDFCPIEMMLVRNKIGQPRAFTFQGHIELPRPYLRELYASRRKLIDAYGEGLTDKAIASLDGPSDELLVTKWALDFLRNAT